MDLQVYSAKGAKQKAFSIKSPVFDGSFNRNLVHQVLVSMMSNLRHGKAHTKDRSEVSGTGKKPWKQKGTGRARHGSRRSPIWVGGGVAFGPRNEKDYSKKLNKKMKRKALGMVLAASVEKGTALGLDSISDSVVKTKDAMEILTAITKAPGFETLNTLSNKNNVLLIAPEATVSIKRAFRNLPHVTIAAASQVDPLALAKARYTIIVSPKESLDMIVSRVQGTFAEDYKNDKAAK